MKKKLLIFAVMFAVLVSVACLAVPAASESDLRFKLNDDGASYYVSGCSANASGILVIPSTYNALPVTRIGDFAFYICDSLTSVTIPDGVTSIDNNAFQYCYSLASVTIPDSVTSIGSGAFDGCRSLTSIKIPEDVTSISDRTFCNCNSLVSVSIPGSVTSIGNSAFYSCDALTSIIIYDGVTTIGDDAFTACNSLVSVSIPDSVTSIGARAFAFSDSLEKIIYNGTRENWNLIEKGTNWLYSNPKDPIVICTDDVFTVTFKNNDGSILSSATYNYGDAVIVPEAPTRSDKYTKYTFTGWSSPVETTCSGNAEYIAVYSEEPVIPDIVWDGTSDTSWYISSKSVFEISTPEQLAGLAELVDSGITFNNISIKLTADIVLNFGDASKWDVAPPANVWEPIGSKDISFEGNFYGQGHIVYGIYTAAPKSGDKGAEFQFKGLFASVGDEKDVNGACITDLNITNSYIGAYLYAGALTAQAKGMTTIENVHVSNTFVYAPADLINGKTGTSNSHVGGIVGFTNGVYELLIDRCSTEDCSFFGWVRVGSIVGSGNGTFMEITDCYSNSVVNAENRPGGIIGHSSISLVVVEDCVFTGDIICPATPNYGGIFGGFRADANAEIELQNCYYAGTYTFKGATVPSRVGATEIGVMADGSVYYSADANDISDNPMTPYNGGEKTGNDPDGAEVLPKIKGEGALEAFMANSDSDIWELKDGAPLLKALTTEPGTAPPTPTPPEEEEPDTSAPYLEIDDARGTVGSTVEVDVYVKNNPGFMSAIFTPDFDPALKLVEVKAGELGGEIEQDINIIFLANSDITEDGCLFTLVFEIPEDTEVGDYTVGIKIRECVNRDEKDVELKFVEDGTVTVIDCIWGDANGDGIVDNKDLVRVKKYIADFDYDTGISTEEISAGADANGDGTVDNKDLVRLKKYIAAYDYDTGTSDVVLGPTV